MTGNIRFSFQVGVAAAGMNHVEMGLGSCCEIQVHWRKNVFRKKHFWNTFGPLAVLEELGMN
jgi:hypothetical protein